MAAIVDAEAGGRGSLPARDADLDSEKQHAPIENASSNASAIVVCFEENDPTNPYNWSAVRFDSYFVNARATNLVGRARKSTFW